MYLSWSTIYYCLCIVSCPHVLLAKHYVRCIPFHRSIPPFHSTIPFHHSISPFHFTIPFHHSIPPFHPTIPFHHSIPPFQSSEFRYPIISSTFKKDFETPTKSKSKCMLNFDFKDYGHPNTSRTRN